MGLNRITQQVSTMYSPNLAKGRLASRSQLVRGEARILRFGGGGLSPCHVECGSTSLYRGSGSRVSSAGPGDRAQVGVGANPSPEAETSVAFEALVEEPNLTLVTDWFLQFIYKVRLKKHPATKSHYFQSNLIF